MNLNEDCLLAFLGRPKKFINTVKPIIQGQQFPVTLNNGWSRQQSVLSQPGKHNGMNPGMNPGMDTGMNSGRHPDSLGASIKPIPNETKPVI